MKFPDQVRRDELVVVIDEALGVIGPESSSVDALIDFLKTFQDLLRGVITDAGPVREARERAMLVLSKVSAGERDVSLMVERFSGMVDAFDPLAYRRPEGVAEVRAYASELDGLAGESLEFARVKQVENPLRLRAFGGLREECKGARESGVLVEFPFQEAYLPSSIKLRAQAGESNQPLPQGIAPFLAFFAAYDPATWTEFPAHAADMDRILGGLNLYLVGLSDPRTLPAKRGSAPDVMYLNELVGFLAYLRFFAKTTRLQGLALVPALENKSFLPPLDAWKAPKDGQNITLHVDAKLMYYHLMQGANIAMNKPGRNPLSQSARMSTYRDFAQFIPKLELSAGGMRAQLLTLFRELFEDADAVLGDVKVENKESILEMDDRAFLAWVKSQFVPQDKQRVLDEKLRAKVAEIGMLEKTCHTEASVVPGEVSGRIGLQGRTSAASIKELTIARRNPERIVYPSNLACEGSFVLDLKGKAYRLDWELHGDGNLFFSVGDKTFGAAQLNGSDGKSCYLESKRLVLLGLRDILKKEGARLEETLPDGTKQNPLTLPGLGGKSVVVRPRVSHMLRTWSQGPGSEVTLTPRGAKVALSALTKLREEGILKEEDIVGLDLYVRQPFTNPQGEKDWIYVMSDTVVILGAVARREFSEEDVFLCQRPGEVVRAGYQPWETASELGTTLNCTQREGTHESQARLHEVERLFKVSLAREVEQMTTVRVAYHIDAVTLGSREELERGQGWTISREHLDKFAQGEREGLSDKILRVELVSGDEVDAEKTGTRQRLLAVLQAPQNVVFNQGTFMSLSEARALQTT